MVKVVAYKNELFKEFKHHEDAKKSFISSLGRVLNGATGLEQTLHNNGAGYLFFLQGTRLDTNRSIREYVHRAVAKCFIENPDNLPQVNHINLDKSNNSVENLEWCSRSANIKHAHSSGAMKKRTENGQITVLTEEQVIDLYTAVVRDGVGISVKAKEMGIPRTTASSIINKRSRSSITDMLDEEYGRT